MFRAFLDHPRKQFLSEFIGAHTTLWLTEPGLFQKIISTHRKGLSLSACAASALRAQKTSRVPPARPPPPGSSHSAPSAPCCKPHRPTCPFRGLGTNSSPDVPGTPPAAKPSQSPCPAWLDRQKKGARAGYTHRVQMPPVLKETVTLRQIVRPILDLLELPVLLVKSRRRIVPQLLPRNVHVARAHAPPNPVRRPGSRIPTKFSPSHYTKIKDNLYHQNPSLPTNQPQ